MLLLCLLWIFRKSTCTWGSLPSIQDQIQKTGWHIQIKWSINHSIKTFWVRISKKETRERIYGWVKPLVNILDKYKFSKDIAEAEKNTIASGDKATAVEKLRYFLRYV